MLATTAWSLLTVTTLWIKSVSEANFCTTDTLDGGAGNDFLIGVDGDILMGQTLSLLLIRPHPLLIMTLPIC
jgi:hypothetical protein